MNPVVGDLDTRGEHDGVTARTIRLIPVCLDCAAPSEAHLTDAGRVSDLDSS